MKHEWEHYTPEDLYEQMGSNGARKCRLCGKVQKKIAQYLWMRVTGYRWEPLIGKCKGKQIKETCERS